MSTTRERRYQTVYFSEHHVFDVLHWKSATVLTMPILEGVPEDVEVVDVRHFWDRKQFGILLWHPSWPIVPERQVPPDLPEVRLTVVRLVQTGAVNELARR